MKKSFILIIVIFTQIIFSCPFVSAQGNAELELHSLVDTVYPGDEFAVEIILKNPGQQKVISVRTWLEYNQAELEGLKIDTEDSLFTLSAPGEDQISQEEGQVKIGRSNISGGVSDAEVKIATVHFRVKNAQTNKIIIKPYDYQVTELGHTSVNIIEQGFPVNILSEEPEDIQITFPGATGTGSINPLDANDLASDIGGSDQLPAVNLIRPTNLKVNTGFGYAELKWDMAINPERFGYNVYYGRTSGQYTRRRTVGNVDRYRIDGLNNGEIYYFAITAYDQHQRESDYSDEVGVIINQPLSSTAPFASVLQATFGKIPMHPQNGPLVGWLIFSAAGLSGTILFKRKK